MVPRAGLNQGQAEAWLTPHWPLLKLMNTALSWLPKSLQQHVYKGLLCPFHR